MNRPFFSLSFFPFNMTNGGSSELSFFSQSLPSLSAYVFLSFNILTDTDWRLVGEGQ